MLKTTRTSLHAHMSGILVADLPKTFRDAVAVSRYLDIPYLWIDSLCIIQGDTEDWVRESSRMTNVYSNAYLVIAANQASDSAGGCFHIRPSRVSANLALPGTGLVHAQLGVNSDELLFLSAKFSDEPLTKRAWALQERLLAARTIHYNTGQMYFECRDGIVGEDGCKSDTPYCDLSPIMNHTCSTREALQTWSSILWTYGDRNLTEPTDKFPAISGMANLLGAMLKDEYVAGLWSSKMVQGLAWQGLGRQLQPINQYIGPSWSWASLQGIAALNTEPNWRSIAIVEDWRVELKNPDNRYGQVNSASMRVRGPIIQLMESTIPGGDYDNSLKRAGLRPKPRFRTKYSGEGGEMTLYLDNEGQNASVQWEEMDMKVLLLGGYEATPPASECEAEEEALKKDKGNWDFEIGEGFGLVLTSKNENGAIYMTRVGWMALVCSEVKRLRESKEDWDTVTII
ncbi:uncharacterized protein FMAN_00066 [Fusarium mangiferae]|uniref:Heterokaryon incompatibility domain-containing protein n=1 Tax=Fusarium mangiferae TaxID=192010 RepID=A0A1L7U077_FUSMA|nr:uncharacterized protein FMAN_00066 [Fusarium mangiferae]CVL02562.1 uncharacterized protein FMAN_00066 [Fusarium mangiferae]